VANRLGIVALVLLAACSAASSGRVVTSPPAASTAPVQSEEWLIDPEQVISGGPPPDGIPAIDEPVFSSPQEVDYEEREPVVSLTVDGEAHAYPLRILLWHEIVNDVVGGVPVAVTYCPLCNTTLVFERPEVEGQLLDFGTSGKLYLSNLIMYDRQTESYWPQVLGKAVHGPLIGTELERLPAQVVSFGDWSRAHPDGSVLTQDTGHPRSYGQNPYPGYDEPDSDAFLFQGEPDPRLPPKARVLGLRVGDDVLAVPFQALAGSAVGDHSVVSVQVGGRQIAVLWQAGTLSAIDALELIGSRDVGAAAAFDGAGLELAATSEGVVDRISGTTFDIFGIGHGGERDGDQLIPVIAEESLWFDWAAFFPETRIASGG
jgi:hypothetical protein